MGAIFAIMTFHSRSCYFFPYSTDLDTTFLSTIGSLPGPTVNMTGPETSFPQ